MTNEEEVAEAQEYPLVVHDGKPVFPDFQPEGETFPWRSLPQTIRGAVIEICKNDRLPVPVAAQSILSAVSLSCQDLIYVDRGIGRNEKTVCSLYLLMVAETGARKSTADEQVIDPIKDYDDAQQAEFEEALKTYQNRQGELERKNRDLEKAEGILRRRLYTLGSSGKKNAAELAKTADADLETVEQALSELKLQIDELRPPRLRKVLYSKTSISELEQGLSENWPAAGLLSDDAAGILNSKNESDMASLNTAFYGSAIDVVGRTKRETFSVQDPRLTLSLMVQPLIFDQFIERKGELAKGIGLMSRVLLSRPDTPYGTRIFQKPEDRSTVWIDFLNKRVREFLQHAHESIDDREANRKTLYFEPDAQKFWEDMYNAVEGEMAPKGVFEHEREFANRYAEHVARLAALFHYFEYGQVITTNRTTDQNARELAIPMSTVEAASAVAEWYLGEFRRVFNPEASMREKAEYVLQKLKEKLERENGGTFDEKSHIRRVPVQRLRENCSRFELKEIANFKPVLEWLHDRGNVILREKERRSGRDTTDRRKLEPEAVEIRSRIIGDDYVFFFDLDDPIRYGHWSRN